MRSISALSTTLCSLYSIIAPAARITYRHIQMPCGRNRCRTPTTIYLLLVAHSSSSIMQIREKEKWQQQQLNMCMKFMSAGYKWQGYCLLVQKTIVKHLHTEREG